MKVSISVMAAAAACSVLAGEAAASIPPPTWTPPTWTGPAKVCGEGFVLKLGAGETVRQGYPTVGVIRYAVETAKGVVEITEYWAASTPAVAPEAEDRPGGKLRPFADFGQAIAGYVFTPDDGKGLPVSVIFRGGEPAAWTGRDLGALLKRIDFNRGPVEGCTEPTR